MKISLDSEEEWYVKEGGGSDMATGKERQGGASDPSWWPAKVHIC